jgi:TATA-binding protein-associated factor Taf7
MLLTHLGLFVRKHIPETKNHQHMRMMSDSITELEKKVERLSNRCDAAASVIKAQQAAIKDISKLVPEMIKEEILKKFA